MRSFVLPPIDGSPQKHERVRRSIDRLRSTDRRRTASTRVLSICVGVCVSLGSCAFTAHQIDPRPKPRPTKSLHALVTQVDDAVPVKLVVEEAYGAPALEIAQWREAIATGLTRGRDGAYQSGPEGAWRVVVLEAVPALVAQELDDTGRALLLTAEIRWRARLFDPLLQPVGDTAGVAVVPGSFRGVSDASPLLSEGIEILVGQVFAFVDEKIAATLSGDETSPEK